MFGFLFRMVPAILIFPLTVAALPQYEVIDLGSFGGFNTNALDVNEDGLIVGGSSNSHSVHHVFLWEPPFGPLVDLTPFSNDGCEAWGINRRQDVVGLCLIDGDVQAFAWSDSRQIPIGPRGSRKSEAFKINDLRQIVGNADFGQGVLTHAYIGDMGRTYRLPELPGASFSKAWDVNNDQWIVGASAEPNATRAVLWRKPNPQKSHYEIYRLADLGGGYSEARAINANGEVVGFSGIQNEYGSYAFYWEPSPSSNPRAFGKARNLGALQGHRSSLATGINSHSVVVGSSDDSEGIPHAVIWPDPHSEPIDLNDLVIGDNPMHLVGANAINDEGLIVGYGATDHYRAFLLKPIED